MEGKTMKSVSFLNNAGARISAAFLGLALLLTAQGSLANHNRSVLELSVWNKGAFEATLNGKVYRSDCDLRLDNLPSGVYHLKIVQRSRNAYGQGGGRVSTLYNATIRIPKNSRVVAELQQSRRLKFLCVESLRPQQARPHNPHPRPQPRPGNGHWNDNDATCGQNDQQVWDYQPDYEPVWEYEEDEPVWEDEVYHGPAVIDQHEFADMLQRMNDAWFEEDRMILARQAIGERMLESEQVLKMLETFNFDSTRLEFAKYAYHHVIDPGRFYIVNEAFNFSSSIRELDEYIAANN
jgi:hypothetical protein